MAKRKAEKQRGVTIYELKQACCRWPLGGPLERARFFCGKPVSRRSYCEFHHAMAHTRPMAAE